MTGNKEVNYYEIKQKLQPLVTKDAEPGQYERKLASLTKLACCSKSVL